MKKRLTKDDRFKFFLVNGKNLTSIKVYKRGFRKKSDAEYAKALFVNPKGLVIMRGYEILILSPTYRLIPYKGRTLKPSQYLTPKPHIVNRIKRARKVLVGNDELKGLCQKGTLRSKVLNTLAREMLIS